MAFLNIPLKSIQATSSAIIGVASMPWYNPLNFPLPPGAPTPAPSLKDYRWRIILDIDNQNQSAYTTRNPGQYNAQDVTVGQWVANLVTGQSWQIVLIESKTTTQVTAIVQDIYRYNTFRDQAQTGNGSPITGTYVIFDVGDTGVPQIDPVPSAGTSPAFGINLQSRFEYINLQYDYPLYQSGNTFAINDTIAVDTVTHGFVKSSATNLVVIGRITSISDTILGWFTINPVQKIVDNLDYLPGYVGDTIYTSIVAPGEITATPGGTQLYLKLRDNTSSISLSTIPNAVTSVGSVFQLNDIDVTVGGTGTLTDVATASNLVNTQTGVNATRILSQNIIQTNSANVSSTYGEVLVWAASSPVTATINSVSVTFNIVSTDPGYTDYARATQMAQSINDAAIPNIVAAAISSGTILAITNMAGGAITIVNTHSDINGVPFAGTSSGSGLPLSTSASTAYQLSFVAIDARAINFLDVVGSAVGDLGLTSVENGVKACGLYIEDGLRKVSSTVVANLAQLNALQPLIGDQAYVIDSNDGAGNNVGEWSMWLFNGTEWVETSNQDSATTDAKSLEYTLTPASASSVNIGQISTGRRVTLITVEVTTAFNNAGSTLSIGYQVNNPTTPAPVPAGLMPSGLIDLTVVGTYTTSTDVLFGTDTEQGDVEITAAFVKSGATLGSVQVIVSYV